jgi:uncharacterized protein (DUF2345 family)
MKQGTGKDWVIAAGAKMNLVAGLAVQVAAAPPETQEIGMSLLSV